MTTMKPNFLWKRLLIGLVCSVFLLGGIFLNGSKGVAGQEKKNTATAYQVYKQKCLGCHDSIADPEKPGRTRDEWHIVVNIMHQHGLDLTDEESEQMIDLLYELRRGLEKDAG
jgi:hypothetical protein